MDNYFSIANHQYSVPNMNQWLIASQLPNVHKVFKERLNKGCNDG